MARVRALFRRTYSEPDTADDVLGYRHPCCVAAKCKILINNEEVDLTAGFKLLHHRIYRN